MDRLNAAMQLAAELPDMRAKDFVLAELRRNTRMSLSSARIVLLSTLISCERSLSEVQKQDIHELMRIIEEMRNFSAGATPLTMY
jgi:hypothetical protein